MTEWPDNASSLCMRLKKLFSGPALWLVLLVGVSVHSPSVQAADQQSTAEVVTKGDRQMSEEELQQRGKQLRADIEQRYKELARAHKLTLNTSIDDVVGKYILIGMSFEDAEKLLQSAGFTYSITNKAPNTPHLTAVVDLPTHRFSKTEVAVDLVPTIPNDFHSNIGKRVAIISHAAL
jgi:hypothetical protein